MQNDTRRLIVAMLVAMGVFIAYRYIVNVLYPPPPPAQVAPGQPEPGAAASGPSITGGGQAETAATTTGVTTTSRGATYVLAAAPETGPLTLGGRDGDALRIELNPRGAAVANLELYARNKKGHFVQRASLGVDEPYKLLYPVNDGQRDQFSFATYRVWIKEYGNQNWPLDAQPWKVAEQSPDHAVFTTTLVGEPGGDLLRFKKVYTLRPGKPVFDLDLSIENVGSAPLTVWVDQDGPIGMTEEDKQYDTRYLFAAQRSSAGVELNKGHQWAELQKATLRGEPVHLLVPDKGPFLWTALANKYFGVYTRPLPVSGSVADYVKYVDGLVAAPGEASSQGDLRARITTKDIRLQPGTPVHYPFEIYAGPKDAVNLAKVDPAYADPTKLNYQVTLYAGRSCSCTFGWLQDLMIWLLEKIHVVVRNYGVAIIILVIIVRGLLHPLSVWQQKSMFRMQEAMSRVQPKLNELKERFANDKVRQNQEMMKLFAEEHVNPAANFVSFVPLFIQMPILVALWTALGTDINLRHAPFDGWWIRDLSAPDALLAFNPPVTVPVLSDIPLLGKVFTHVAGINLLPILMGISMWLQQKYMPKPAMQAKLEAAKKQQAAKGKGGMSPQDQLRQQQIMAYMMSILFPLMFYTMPSGLNLYWMSTNIFGICESLIIRKQIEEERQRRAREGPRPPKPPGLVGRFLKGIAAQAEDLQRKADELSPKDTRKKKP